MEWKESFDLGLARMDDTHREFVELYNNLANSPSDRFVDDLDRFIEHTILHFEQENRWMDKVGFPACHKSEHERVLAVMQEVRKLVVAGDLFLGQRLVEELPAWFDSHATGMDAALAFYLNEVGFDFERECATRAASAGGGCSPTGCSPAVTATEASVPPQS